MKVLKPQRLGMLQRVVEHRRRCTLVVSALVYVPLDSPRKLLTEQVLWKDVAATLPSGVADEGYPKPRSETLVAGSAFAPGGKPAQAVMTRLSVSRAERPLIDKRLAVWGDRHWVGNEPSDAIPFAEMPIDWAHAFGGEGFDRNPLGKGIRPVATERGELLLLPNVENPKQLVTSPKDRPEPVGFGPLDLTWPQRFSKIGKRYDAEWLETRFPGPAEDFDATFYDVASPDQQFEGFFNGDETIVVEGMHPERAKLELSLVPLVVRVLATQRDDGGTSLRDLGARLDTVHVLPRLERALLVYRATLPVAEDDADDIEHLILAAEDPAHPKTVEHYQRVLALRLDKEKGAFASMNDADLMPPAELGWLAKPDYGDIGEMTRLEQRKLANGERGRKGGLAVTRAELTAAGFDVDASFEEEALPPQPDPHDIEGVMTYLEEMEKITAAKQVDLDKRKAESEASARAAFAEAGFDWDAEAKKALEQAGGPPTFSADEQLMMLHDMARIAAEGGQAMPQLEQDLTDPKYEEMLRVLEAQVRDAYVRFAHLMPGAKLPPPERRQILRALAVAAKEGGEPLAGRNLCGADLHGLDLRDVDLSGAFLEGADLSGADLSGANLERAVLTRATLTGTRLCHANLRGANLGATVLRNTNLTEASLDETVLHKSELDGAILQGASVRSTDFIETSFTTADLSHVEAHQPLFLQVDLRGVVFTGARLAEARFLQVDARGVDFTGCEMEKAQLVQVKGDDAMFSGAQLRGAVFVHESSFARAIFSGADLTGANFHKTPLTGANFEQSKLDGASLGGCDLRGANLHRVSGRGALLIRADLQRANLRGADLLDAIAQKAKLGGADLTGANLSRADVSLVRTDGETRLADALMIDTRVDPKHQERR